MSDPEHWFFHAKAQISNIAGFLNTDSFFIRVSSPSIVSSDCLNCYHPVDKLPWSRV